jgi:3',5'-cyclic AMP phosphodiesterase CpdA
MRLAHVSDLHLLDLHGISPGRFFNRRAIGGANLLIRRAREYRPAILETLIDDLLKEEVDHVALSGDLSNLALETEFDRVFHLLKLLGGWNRVSVVPGNHDYYTWGAAETRRFEKVFYPFMFKRDFSDLDVDVYPYVKEIGELKLIGINSATRTIPPLSYGTLGEGQLERVEKILAAPDSSSHLTCLLCHHALHRRDLVTEMSSGLLHRDRLLALIDKYKVDLVLYGHDHRGREWRREQEGHSTLMVCCGSATRLVEEPELLARYRIITLEDGRVRRLETKVYDPSSRRFLWE